MPGRRPERRLTRPSVSRGNTLSRSVVRPESLGSTAPIEAVPYLRRGRLGAQLQARSSDRAARRVSRGSGSMTKRSGPGGRGPASTASPPKICSRGRSHRARACCCTACGRLGLPDHAPCGCSYRPTSHALRAHAEPSPRSRRRSKSGRQRVGEARSAWRKGRTPGNSIQAAGAAATTRAGAELRFCRFGRREG